MNALRMANDALAFLLEIAALVALAVWGFTVGPNLVLRLVLGLGAPAALVAVWGVWLAPTSDHRLASPWLVVAKVVVFGLATAALAVSGHPRVAVVLGVLAAVNLVLAVALGDRSGGGGASWRP